MDFGQNPNEMFKNAINYFRINIEHKKIINELDAYKAVFFFTKFNTLFEDSYFDGDVHFERIVAEILFVLYEIRHEINFNEYIPNTDSVDDNLSLNDRRANMLAFLLYLTNILSLQSHQFSKEFSMSKGLDTHIYFLKDEKFLKNNLNATLTDFSKSPLNMIDFLSLNICSLSRKYEYSAKRWHDLDTVNVLLKLPQIKNSSQFNSYLAITNIASDSQIESLKEIHLIIKDLVFYIDKCGKDFENGNFKRYKRQLIIDDKATNCTVHCLEIDDGCITSILVFLNSLYRLLINDTLRIEIYFKYKIKDTLKKIIFMGNNFESNPTIKLFAQLTFNKEICIDLKKDSEFIDYLTKHSNDLSSYFNSVCSQVLWNLNKSEDIIAEPLSLNIDKEHVMISYNSNSRELCLKVKSNLEYCGFKVWIDVNDIHGSSLDSMASAIEKSFCVLMCVTEKYRQSVNCQAEAQYAFKIKKPIIPLIMQPGYENPKGWLGIIMGDKIFINFIKYNFDECINRLKKELSSLNPNIKPVLDESHQASLSLNDNKINKKNLIMSEDQVREWFIENNLSQNIMQSLLPCDGSVLEQLYEMRRDAPEFYFQSLKLEYNLDLKNISLFTTKLKKLFEKF